jgi:protein-disulfide isomerase
MNTDKINVPMAIIVAGLLVAIAVFTSGTPTNTNTNKGLSSKLGLNSKKLNQCLESGETKDKVKKDTESGDKAMAHIGDNGRGTPYNVLLSSSGAKIEVPGAQPYESFKSAIDAMLGGQIPAENGKEINLDPIIESDHVFGNRNAEVFIVEYSDLECPFCARVHPTLHKLVEDYDGKVAWVYRHYPIPALHENAELKARASECAALQGGDEVFFKYINEVFEMIQPTKPTFDTSTL